MISNIKIAIIGLGYVGLPLAIEFGKKYPVVGFDISNKRIHDLRKYIDKTNEINTDSLKESKVIFTDKINDLKDSNVFIITVPTPIDDHNTPDLSPLITASQMIGELIKRNDIVIYESTTYPGCTEEICVPLLEAKSGLIYNKDFFVGYSPERINPGDKVNTLTSIKKVTSGSNPEIAKKIDGIYRSIISAGTFLASSIKVAEASKAIENAQRDLNISFVNELSIIFDKLGIDTKDVIEAASTKWNFLKFQPGLVGGHCIGVDPYYLAYKAESAGYSPQVILSGRRVNNSMPKHVADKLIKTLIKSEKHLVSSKILILGFSFKENCPDFRNTKVIDVYRELNYFGLKVDIFDPLVSESDVVQEYDIKLKKSMDIEEYEAIILAVPHTEFLKINFSNLKRKPVIFDLKGVLDKNLIHFRL